MVRVTRLKGNAAEKAVNDLRDSGVYEVVMIERQGAIRRSFVPE